MTNAMVDARQEGGSYRRVEVITGERRRRRWTGVENAPIVAESREPGANISDVDAPAAKPGRTKSHQLHELLAWNWKATHPRAVAERPDRSSSGT